MRQLGVHQELGQPFLQTLRYCRHGNRRRCGMTGRSICPRVVAHCSFVQCILVIVVWSSISNPCGIQTIYKESCVVCFSKLGNVTCSKRVAWACHQVASVAAAPRLVKVAKGKYVRTTCTHCHCVRHCDNAAKQGR